MRRQDERVLEEGDEGGLAAVLGPDHEDAAEKLARARKELILAAGIPT